MVAIATADKRLCDRATTPALVSSSSSTGVGLSTGLSVGVGTIMGDAVGDAEGAARPLQRAVLRAALALFDNPGPGPLLEDFLEQAPRGDADWIFPGQTDRSSLQAEVLSIRPFWQQSANLHAPRRCLIDPEGFCAILIHVKKAALDLRMQRNNTGLQSVLDL